MHGYVDGLTLHVRMCSSCTTNSLTSSLWVGQLAKTRQDFECELSSVNVFARIRLRCLLVQYVLMYAGPFHIEVARTDGGTMFLTAPLFHRRHAFDSHFTPPPCCTNLTSDTSISTSLVSEYQHLTLNLRTRNTYCLLSGTLLQRSRHVYPHEWSQVRVRADSSHARKAFARRMGGAEIRRYERRQICREYSEHCQVWRIEQPRGDERLTRGQNGQPGQSRRHCLLRSQQLHQA